MQAFYTCFLKFCLALNSYKLILMMEAVSGFALVCGGNPEFCLL